MCGARAARPRRRRRTPFEQRPRGVRDRAAVGQMRRSGRSEARMVRTPYVGRDGKTSRRRRRAARRARKGTGPAVSLRRRLADRIRRASGKMPPQVGQRALARRSSGSGPAARVKAAQPSSPRMFGVALRVEHRVNTSASSAAPAPRRSRRLDEDRRARPAGRGSTAAAIVARIRRQADGAGAANHRHAHRRACRERDFHWTGGRNWPDGRGAVVSGLRQGMMMRDFSGTAPPSLLASMYFRRSS